MSAGAATIIRSRPLSRRPIAAVARVWCSCHAQTAATMQLVSGVKPGTASAALASQALARTLHRLGSHRGNPPARHGHQQPTLLHQADRQRGGLDLYATISGNDFHWHARTQSRLASNILGDHESAGRINGRSHAMNDTTSRASSTAARRLEHGALASLGVEELERSGDLTVGERALAQQTEVVVPRYELARRDAALQRDLAGGTAVRPASGERAIGLAVGERAVDGEPAHPAVERPVASAAGVLHAPLLTLLRIAEALDVRSSRTGDSRRRGRDPDQ